MGAAQQQQNISDLQYSEEAMKNLQKNAMDNEAASITAAQRAQRLRALAEEKKMKEKLAESQRNPDFNKMDPETNPIIQESRYKQNLLNEQMYKQEAREHLSDEFFPQTLTGTYEAGKNVHQATADQFYSADAKAAHAKDYQDTKHQIQNSHPDQPGYRQAATNAINQSNRLYVQGAEEFKHEYTAEVDTPEMRQVALNNRNYSRKAYREAYRRMIEGCRAQTQIESHPEYVNAKNAQKALSDNNYQQDSKSALTRDLKGIDEQHESFSRSKKVAETLNNTKYSQSKREAVNQYRGFQTMENHPQVAQHQYQAAMQSQLGYHGEHNQEKQDVFFPQTTTEVYETQKNLKNVNLTYSKIAKEEMPNVNYNFAETEHAINQQKLHDTMTTYASNPGAGDYRKSLKDTPVIATSQKMQEINRNYLTEGEKIKHEYTTEIDTPEYRQQKLNEWNASRKKYREAYAKMLADRGSVFPDRKMSDHPEYVLSNQHSKNISDNRYKAESNKINQVPVGTADLERPDVQQVKKNQTSISDRLYTQSGKDVQSECKGFLTMQDNPEVAKHAYYGALHSDRGYQAQHNEEKTQVYFPSNITPKFEQDKLVAPFKSDKTYKKDLEHSHQIQYNMAETEKYQQDAALKETMETYDADFQQSKQEPNNFPGGMLDSALYQAQLSVGRNVSDSRYAKEGKEILKKNYQDQDALQLKQNAYAQHIQSDNQYKATHNKEVKGQRSHLPIENHPEYMNAAQNTKNSSDNHYRAGNEDVIHKYTLDPMDQHIDLHRRNAKTMDSAAYEQSRLDANKKYKFWLTMDGYQHPITKKVERDRELYSMQKYTEEWND